MWYVWVSTVVCMFVTRTLCAFLNSFPPSHLETGPLSEPQAFSFTNVASELSGSVLLTPALGLQACPAMTDFLYKDLNSAPCVCPYPPGHHLTPFLTLSAIILSSASIASIVSSTSAYVPSDVAPQSTPKRFHLPLYCLCWPISLVHLLLNVTQIELWCALIHVSANTNNCLFIAEC